MKPLRRIVETKRYPYSSLVHIEVLECGHEQRQKTDIIGPTNAYRRRCRRCPDLAPKVPR
jgi:hypothetical protein